MRLDRRFAVVVTLSLVWGLVVAGTFYRVAGAGRVQRAEPRRPVVLAAAQLPQGALVDRNSVKLGNLPESLFPKGGFTRVEDVLERPVIGAMQEGEPLVEARLAARGSGLGLGPLIPPGMRALSVRVNDVVGVAGFVLPGMRVDVLVTGRPPGVTDTITRTVLQDVPVLSAGQTVQNDGKNQAITAPVVTLLLDPHQAEVLTLASNEGHIQLVLRNSTDRQVAPTRGRELHELYAGAAREPAPAEPQAKVRKSPVRPPAAAPPPPPPPVAVAAKAPDPQVLVIRGSVKTVESAPVKGGEKK